MTTPSMKPAADRASNERLWWSLLQAGTILNCLVQTAWLWRFRAHNINMDGIAYIGLARHLTDGDFKASLHGYWGPMTSWIIAAASLFSRNFTLLGRLVTIGSFLLCLPLLYFLTLKLWRSRSAAALAVLWFSLVRGIIPLAIGSILADFVLTACVLLYFQWLLEALRENTSRKWTPLGVAHALAFLAKAIALPWLSISTAVAVGLKNIRHPRTLVTRTGLAFLVPALIWLGWSTALHAKYGVFTSGYQLRANLMVNWHRRVSHLQRGDDLGFSQTPSLYDNYMVAENWPLVRTFSLRNPLLPTMIVESEISNVPRAIKELLIQLTPAGALSLLIMFGLLLHTRSQYDAEFAFVCIALISTTCAIGAYCMLVLDYRYLIPITAVLISICCPIVLPVALVPNAPRVSVPLRRIALAIFAASITFFFVYPASPFRAVDRDFETSCYEAANILRSAAPQGTLVSVGNGPYPEHGVGFEVGSYVSYLAGWRLVGGNAGLPPASDIGLLAAKVLGTNADAVAVWGSPADSAYTQIVTMIRQAPAVSETMAFSDSRKGEVGTIFLFDRKPGGSALATKGESSSYR